MATPTLTTRGRRYAPSTAATPTAVLERWHQTLERMLTLAIDYGKLDALVKKRRAWLAANPFHELHDERHALMWEATRQRNEIGGKVMDLATELSRLQQQMPADMIDGLGALMGHPLWPYAGQKWAMAAARLQTADIFAIAARVYMELRAEDEAMEATA